MCLSERASQATMIPDFALFIGVNMYIIWKRDAQCERCMCFVVSAPFLIGKVCRMFPNIVRILTNGIVLDCCATDIFYYMILNNTIERYSHTHKIFNHFVYYNDAFQF